MNTFFKLPKQKKNKSVYGFKKADTAAAVNNRETDTDPTSPVTLTTTHF